MKSLVYIGLGSNVGDREGFLRDALNLIGGDSNIEITVLSSVTETDPVDFYDQPRFLNQIIKAETSLEPADLLGRMKNIEETLGRKRRFDKGPREIDLDILLYDDLILESADLTIPHREIVNRGFILDHLIELDPELVDPRTNKKYSEVQKA